MQRQEIIALVERRALSTARRLFGLSQDSLSLVVGYEGCANLVYEGRRQTQYLSNNGIGSQGSRGFSRTSSA